MERIIDNRDTSISCLIKKLKMNDRLHLKVPPFTPNTVRIVCSRESEKERIREPLKINRYKTSSTIKPGHITVWRTW